MDANNNTLVSVNSFSYMYLALRAKINLSPFSSKLLPVSDGKESIGFTKLMLVIVLTLMGSACMREETSLPKEGDIVTWKQNEQLVIKAKLGQRREHVSDSKLFNPKLERYVGQFPIDYVPEVFPSISKEEVDQLTFPAASHQLEFSLMLNGSQSVATNEAWVFTDKGLNHPDQVQVMLSNIDPKIVEKSSGRPFRDTRKWFEYRLKKQLDESTKVTENSMDCYLFTKTLDSASRSRLCFGESHHPQIAGFQIYISGGSESIFASSDEWIYGGMQLRWSTHKQNLHHAKDIDAAIWRLLDSWNVVPTQ